MEWSNRNVFDYSKLHLRHPYLVLISEYDDLFTV